MMRWLTFALILIATPASALVSIISDGPQHGGGGCTGVCLVAHTIKQCTGVGCSSPGDLTTDAINGTGANLSVVAVGLSNVGGSVDRCPNGLSDSNSNSYTFIGSTTAGANDVTAAIYYNFGGTYGSGMTFTCSNGTFPTVAVELFSGASAGLDQQNGSSGTSITSLSTGSITPAHNNEVVVSALAVGGGSSSYTCGSCGLTITDNANISATAYGVAMGYVQQTSATAINPGWSWTGSTSAAAVVTSYQ